MTPGLHNDLFTADPSKSGNSRWQLYRAGTALALGTETRELGAIHQELLDQIKACLLPYGEMGTAIWEQLRDGFSLVPLIEALAAGQFAQAEHELRSPLYALMGILSDLTARMEQESGKAAALQMSTDQLAVAPDMIDEIGLDMMVNWASAAETVIQTIEQLRAIEGQITTARQAMGKTQRTCRESVGTPEALTDLEAYLEGSSTYDGLLIVLDEYLESDLPRDRREAIEAEIAQARERIGDIRAAEEAVTETWEAMVEESQHLAELYRPIHEQCVLLTDAMSHMDKYEQQFAGSVRPYQIEGGDALISEAEYLKASALCRDSSWGPTTASNRLQGLLGATLAILGEQPCLADGLRRLVEDAEGLIRNVTRRHDDPTEVERVPAPAPTLHRPTPETAAHEESPPSARPRGPTGGVDDHDRIETIYELIICVGYELCVRGIPDERQYQHFQFSTTWSMMRVLVAMGLITEEELTLHRTQITERSKHSGERVRFRKDERGSKKTSVKKLWESAEETWVDFAPRPGQFGLKLTRSQEVRAQTTLRAHGITAAEIRAGYERMREIREAERAARREADE